VREHEIEPIPGLPEQLPAGEKIIWQGAPTFKGIALHVLHVRAVAIYFGLLFAGVTGSAIWSGAPYGAAIVGNSGVVAGGIAACALLTLFAWLIHRSTLYTITTRRVVLRFGIALPMSANVPFSSIQAADLKLHGDGSGDIALALNGEGRQSLVVLWPHVRPWHTVRPQPALRCIPNAKEVAETLATAVTSAGHPRLVSVGTARPQAGLEPVPQSSAA
jgi:hypothetical protein